MDTNNTGSEPAELAVVNGGEGTGLAREALRRELEECRTIYEAKDLRAKAIGLAEYARKARDYERQNLAVEMRFRYEAFIGQRLIDMKAAGERIGHDGASKSSREQRLDLSDFGITRDESSKWQRLAGMVGDDEARFDEAFARTLAKYGELSEAALIRELARDEKDARLAEIRARLLANIDGRYDVMVFDPPWPVAKVERDERPLQTGLDYPTQEIEEITASLAELVTKSAAPECHVFLWTTNKFLLAAGAMLEAIGARYVCTFVWHKPGGFQPYGLPQYNCEFALYARIGTPSFIDTKDFPLCFEAPRGAHSEKPEVFYERLRRTTAGRRLDAHSRRAIEGFDGGGNEANAKGLETV